jgi:hypothetical protein
MAVGVVLEFPGGTLEQYDQVIEKMGLTEGGDTPEGAIFHWVTKTDDGFRVTDVWESRQAFERFAQEKIGPLSQEVGVPGPSKTTFFEVHNYLIAS